MSTATEVETKIKLKVPSLYKVVILNDDFTPMEFVIQVFKEIFGKSHSEAYKLTLEIHEKGKGIGGLYPKDIAQQKADEVRLVAEHHEHPLRATFEQA